MNLIGLVLFCGAISQVCCSHGDRSYFYAKCTVECIKQNCTGIDGVYQTQIKSDLGPPSLFTWECNAECGYNCMWKTTDHFIVNRLGIPQFFGKWPFYRILGIQEPASVVFSIMNMAVNLIGIWKFRRQISSDSPMYYVWHLFCAICCNGWLWSIVFHTRDFPITEFLDYAFAYSIVLTNCTCMILRMIHGKSTTVKCGVSTVMLALYIGHVARLRRGSFDYAYNMQANVVTGLVAGIGWLIWCIRCRAQWDYAWKVCCVQLLAGCSLTLELMDFPPIWYTFDAHSLWHLCTVPLTVLFYSFIIDDCKRLRSTNFYSRIDDEMKKLI